MRKVRSPINILSLLIVLIVFMGFMPKPKTFLIDTDSSSASWIGRSVAGNHSGTVHISSGELLVANGKVNEGSVQVDMNSLTVSSIGDLQLNSQVTGKLKGKDFFDTYNHPLAMFNLVSVRHESGSNYTLAGSLTIKGKTQSVRFPALINQDKKQINVVANITVDRTKFNILSGSDDFDKNAGTPSIHNEFGLTLHIVAKRK